MRATGPLRVVAVLDATTAAAERHARALGGFLRDGLALTAGSEPSTVTHLFCAPDAGTEAILAAPTQEVRLIRVPPRRADIIAAALAAFEASGGADLFVFPSGPSGTEAAARLAACTGGSVLTGVLTARETDGGGLTCRCPAYAGHLAGEFELGSRPWCITLDASWADTRFQPPAEHAVQAEARLLEGDASLPPLREVERLEPPETGDLETAKLLVVAGRGAGSRGGVERVAVAAARMGAAFGVTRPVVMNGWAGADRQVGVSGTRTVPTVCIVAGASGAPAFLWGVERAGFIAAVDTDDQAPIAREADAIVAGDAVDVLEALADLLDPQASGGTRNRPR